MLTRLQKLLDEQEEAREREKAALEKDVVMRVQNQLLVQVEVLRRAWMRGSYEKSRTHHSQPHAMDATCSGGNRIHVPTLRERSDESKIHKFTKTSHIEDLVEMVRKRIDEDKSPVGQDLSS